MLHKRKDLVLCSDAGKQIVLSVEDGKPVIEMDSVNDGSLAVLRFLFYSASQAVRRYMPARSMA